MVKNGVYTVGRFSIYTLSGVFFVPFLVRQYGSGAYGLIALAGFLTQYVGLVSRCVGNSVARFLNVALNKNDWKQANEIFSTALVANAVLILVQIPLFAVGIWKLDFLIDFPPEAAVDFRILVVCNVLVFFISMMTGVFITPIQAANRLDISSTIDSLRIALRLVLLFFLIINFGAKLWIIGVVDLGLAIANTIATYALYRILAKDLRYSFRHISRKWVRPVMKMAGWTIVTAIGASLFLNTDVWMINRFVGKEMAGVYAAILVWPNFIRQISKQVAAVLTPVYLIDYARGNIDRIARISMSSAKLIGCLAGLMVGFLCVVAEPLLVLWLGPGSEVHGLLFRVMLFHLVFNIGESTLWQIYTTINKVHFAGIVSLVSGVLNIVVSLTLIYFGLGAVGVAAGTAFALFLSCGLAIPLGVCRELNVPYRTIGKNYAYAILAWLVATGATIAGLYAFRVTIIGGIALFILLFALGGAASLKVVLSQREKHYAMQLIQKGISKVKGWAATRNDGG